MLSKRNKSAPVSVANGGTPSSNHFVARVVLVGGFVGLWVATVDQLLFLHEYHPDLLRTAKYHWIEICAAVGFCFVGCMVLSLLFHGFRRLTHMHDPVTWAGITVLAGAMLGFTRYAAFDYPFRGTPFLLAMFVNLVVGCVMLSIIRRWKVASLGGAMLGVFSVALLMGLATDLFIRSTREGGGSRTWWLAILVHVIIVLPSAMVLLRLSVTASYSFRKRLLLTVTPGVLLAIVNVSVGLASRPSNTHGESPNVILIVLDAIRRDHIGLYGARAATPNIDAFFCEGIIFDEAYCAASWTLPSMTAMFSERYLDILLQQHRGAYQVASDTETLAEALSQRGYATGAFSANPSLDQRTGVMRGFQEVMLWNHHRRRDTLDYVPLLFRRLYNKVRPVLAKDRRFAETTIDVLAQGRRFLEKNQDVNFYLWLHVMSPHDPYDPEPSMVRDGYEGRLKSDYYATRAEFPSDEDMRKGRFIPTEEDKAHIVYLYQKEVENLDRLLGPFFDYVEKQGLLENTIILLVSDHGEELWDHGDYYHGFNLFMELTAVPLIFRVPGLKARRVSGLVETIDLMPTLKELCDVPRAAEVDGRSLVAALRGDEIPPKPVFAAQHTFYLYALRDSEYAALWNPLKDERYLFDRSVDPREQNNLAEEKPLLMNQYIEAIQQQREKIFARARMLSGKDTTDLEKRQDEIHDQLEAMGYIR